jgi:hypothetical protein
MTPEELKALPPGLAVKALIETLTKSSTFTQKLAEVEAPKPVRPPKFDAKISRKGGYQWASETDLDGLRWWFNRFTASAADGGQYAEKDQKRADKLAYWVAYREAYPDAVWTGQRNDEVCTASAPSGQPTVHEWEPRGEKPLRDDRSDADDSGGGDNSFPAGW